MRLFLAGTSRAPVRTMGQAARRFTELRAWQTSNTYKQAVYRACADGPLSRDWARRRQLEESVAEPPDHLAEGFRRANPGEFTRFSLLARSSLIESQNLLREAVDNRYITEEQRGELDALAEEALREVAGLLDYLESAQALQSARRSSGSRSATALPRSDSSLQSHPAHSTHSGSCADTAGDSPRRSRKEARRRSRS
jgi:four helix bundle protein